MKIVKPIGNTKYFRLKRVKDEWLEKGRRKEKKAQERVLQAIKREWDKKIEEQGVKTDEQRSERKKDHKEHLQTVQDMRQAQAQQIKLVRKFYFDKAEMLESLMNSNKKREYDLNLRHAEFNAYLATVLVRIEKMVVENERVLNGNAVAHGNLKTAQKIHGDFLNLVKKAGASKENSLIMTH